MRAAVASTELGPRQPRTAEVASGSRPSDRRRQGAEPYGDNAALVASRARSLAGVACATDGASRIGWADCRFAGHDIRRLFASVIDHANTATLAQPRVQYPKQSAATWCRCASARLEAAQNEKRTKTR